MKPYMPICQAVRDSVSALIAATKPSPRERPRIGAIRIVIPYEPRIVVTYAGENDIDAGTSASAVARDFAKFAAEVQWALPRTTLIFISMKPGITRAGIAGVIHEANHRIRTYCGTHPGLTYLDIEPLML